MTSSPDRAANPRTTWIRRGVTAALAVYWLAMFAGTHLPIDPNVVVPGNDKTLHVVGYGGLAFLFGLFLAVRRSGSRAPGTIGRRRLPYIGAFVLLALYGVFDELTQLLVGRTCDVLDWAADCAGITLGLIVAMGAIGIGRRCCRPVNHSPDGSDSCVPQVLTPLELGERV